MKYWEKWYWATYIRGQNPISAFFWGLINGFWVPIVLSAIFCLITDPQFKHIHGFSQFSPTAYLTYYCFFWKTVITVCWHYLVEYTSFAWNHWDEVVGFARKVFWFD